MTNPWNLDLLAAVVADIRTANLRTKNGSPEVWRPVAQMMWCLAGVDEQHYVWRNRFDRNIKRQGPGYGQNLSESYVRNEFYHESLQKILSGEGWAVKAPVASEPTLEIEFPDLKRKAESGWGMDFLDVISDVQDTMKALDTQQNVAHAVINTDLPVGVVFPGDFHLGGRGTNHRLMKQDMLMWKALGDAIKVAGMGDYSEQFSGALARIASHQHVMTNDMQIETVMEVFCNALLKQWLVLLEGNHDGWAGAELARYVMRMAQRVGVPFLGKGGELFLTVGQVEYKLALWHRYPGASALNKGNNQRRVRIDHNGADVVALAHLHNAYMEFSSTGDVDHVGFRCGAYKTVDEHSRDAAGNVIADSRMPMVIFNPREKDLLYFEDFKKGIPDLLRLRREWADYPSFKVDSTRLDRLLYA